MACRQLLHSLTSFTLYSRNRFYSSSRHFRVKGTMNKKHLSLDAILPITINWYAKVRVTMKGAPRIGINSPVRFQKLNLADEMGNSVEGVLFESDIELYQETLEVDKTYVISNASVKPPKEGYEKPWVTCPYQWIIDKRTSVLPFRKGLICATAFAPKICKYSGHMADVGTTKNVKKEACLAKKEYTIKEACLAKKGKTVVPESVGEYFEEKMTHVGTTKMLKKEVRLAKTGKPVILESVGEKITHVVGTKKLKNCTIEEACLAKKGKAVVPESVREYSEEKMTHVGTTKKLKKEVCLAKTGKAVVLESVGEYFEQIMAAPKEIKFEGHISYSRTMEEVERAADELLHLMEAKKKIGGQCILGLDVEWKPSFQKGVPTGRAAVIQICEDKNHSHVFHIIQSRIPKNFRRLLEDPSCVKVGVGIAYDSAKVCRDHGVSINGITDLADLANQKLGGPPKRRSLSTLAELLIYKQLPKPRKVRLGNWEAKVLSKEQIEYAATDAYISWYLYQVLINLPDPTVADTAETIVPTN